MNLKPLRDTVLIEPVHRTIPSAGIHVPDRYQESPTEGLVLAIGPKVNSGLQVGQRVMFSRHDGHEVQIGGKDYRLIPVKGIIAILA